MSDLQEEGDRCPMVKGTKKAESNANLGFEAKLWLSADNLRNNMDAAEYKYVVLGLIFLKYTSDTQTSNRYRNYVPFWA